MAIKQFKWKGKLEEEIKQLDLDTFIRLVGSRQRRSLKRGFTDAQKVLLKRIDNGDKNIKTHCRDMIILPKMVGMTIGVYNGKEWHRLDITAEMLGHYLGEFALTRKSVTHSAAGIGATRSSKAVSAR
ncbi:MAG TPA: 30S ribosomal protein S19 [Candidatus Nanoarchaeia archaeon]|nr:30S ribosomal protein S19 [Candidatus Nanoarchaeia archaeon]